MTSPNLALPHWADGDSTPQTKVNAAVDGLDDAVNATVTFTFPSDADATMTAATWTGGAVIRVTGSITAPRVITVPATARKVEIWNETGQTVTIRSASPSDPVVDVDVAAGVEAGIVSDGPDIRDGASGSGGTSLTKATASDIRSGTADVYIDPDGVEAAAALVTLTDAATIAVDWATFLNGTVTLGGNRTLGAPTNAVPGTTRTLIVVQDGTGSRTLGFNAVFKHPGGVAPVLSTAAGAVDLLMIYCRTTSDFLVTVQKGFA